MTTSPEQIAAEMAAGSELARLRRVNAELVAALEAAQRLPMVLSKCHFSPIGVPEYRSALTERAELLNQIDAALSTAKEMR